LRVHRALDVGDRDRRGQLGGGGDEIGALVIHDEKFVYNPSNRDLAKCQYPINVQGVGTGGAEQAVRRLRATRVIRSGEDTRQKHDVPAAALGVVKRVVGPFRDNLRRDIVLREGDAEAMISETGGAAMLGPFRGRPAADVASLAACLAALADFAQQNADLLEEVEGAQPASKVVGKEGREGPRCLRAGLLERMRIGRPAGAVGRRLERKS